MSIEAGPGRAPKPLPIHGPADTGATITELDSPPARPRRPGRRDRS